jgi:hypothetical protein
MVADELTDGTKIGQHLSSELHGHERGVLGRLAVVDADTDAEPSEAGTFAFAVAVTPEEDGTDQRIAETYLHPNRIRIEFLVQPVRAAEAGHREGLCVRPGDADSLRTLAVVESAAKTKAALRVVRRVAEEFLDDGG